jgi:two-component system CheB/CheR fusion protein
MEPERLAKPPSRAAGDFPPAAAPDPGWDELLAAIRAILSLRLEHYKQASLQRRVGKRMAAVGAAGFAEYAAYLAAHPQELPALLDTVFVNVTGFFRDAAGWQALRAALMRRLLDGDLRGGGPIRVWSAGCATGEEAYTLAMLLMEAVGIEEAGTRVTIFATDVDEAALAAARRGAYAHRAVDGVPSELLERYFVPTAAGFQVSSSIRRMVVFGRHDLTVQAPVGRVDLLACRNTLIYLNARAQETIFGRFHFALNEGGLLFLGRAETVAPQVPGFSRLDLDRHLLVKLPTPHRPRAARRL